MLSIRTGLFLITLGLLPVLAAAERVQVPLSLPLPFIESVLREQGFTGPGETVRINDDGTGCQFLELRRPSLTSAGALIRVRTHAEARLGRKMGGRCLLLATWYGQLEFDQSPAVGDDGTSVLLRTTGWRAFKPNGSPDSVSTTIGQWLDAYLPSRLKETRISIARPLSELENFVGSMLATQAGAGSLLESVHIDGVAAREDDLTVTLGIDVAPAPPPPGRTEPALTDAELALLSERLDAVDAFFTYTLRALSEDGETDLTGVLDVLVDLRRDLVGILARREWSHEDPARALFVRAWDGLTPLLHHPPAVDVDQAEALRYLTFIGAGDALKALDALGPRVGIEVTGDGLRRLARMLLPEDPADPLARDDGVDPELRRAFGFGPPLPPPHYAPDSSWLDWFIPSAVAASSLNPKLTDRLNSWVPKSRDMHEYLPMVREVLHYVIDAQLRTQPLGADFQPIFRRLVYSAAWQESCWRQFEARNNMRVPVQSSTGDVGMMQINPKVWRGFYDLQGLRWDIVYNARAGADILQHHLVNYAIGNNEHRVTGSSDSLARAAYAAYNGGPRQYDRYRRSNAPAQGRKVDELFREKYQAVKQKGEMAVRACYGG